jgi:hypothetical protein
MNTWFLFRDFSTPLIALGVIVFSVIAAIRWKSKGLWILAAAFILRAISDVAAGLMSGQFLYQHPNAMYFMSWVGVGSYVAMILSLVGWCILVFAKKRGKSHDA